MMKNIHGSERNSGILISAHEHYRVYFVPGGGTDVEDALTFESLRGRLRFAILFSNAQQELPYLISLLRQADGGYAVVHGAPIGRWRRLLLRLFGRSIDFADEFSAQVKDDSDTTRLVERATCVTQSQKLLQNHYLLSRFFIRLVKIVSMLPGKYRFSRRFVFARLSGWFRPQAMILVTIASRSSGFLIATEYSAKFRKWRLSFDDCRKLADGLEVLLAPDP